QRGGQRRRHRGRGPGRQAAALRPARRVQPRRPGRRVDRRRRRLVRRGRRAPGRRRRRRAAAGRLGGARAGRRRPRDTGAPAVGERKLMVGGTVLAAVGATAAVTTSSLPVALAGFVLVGLGLANLFPLAIARAGLLGGAPGIALATTVGYTGLLGGPPAIGLLAQTLGLPVALGTVAVLALVAGVLVTTVAGDRVRIPRPR